MPELIRHSPVWEPQNRTQKGQRDQSHHHGWSTGGAKRQQPREISLNIHAVTLTTYFRSAALICCRLLSLRWRTTVCPLASCWPSSANLLVMKNIELLSGLQQVLLFFFFFLPVLICCFGAEEQPRSIRQEEAAEPFGADGVCFLHHSLYWHYIDWSLHGPIWPLDQACSAQIDKPDRNFN